jgi:hypothetical protein
MFTNRSPERFDSVCPTCNRMLWWRSRMGRRVCMVCHPDPLDALGTLLSARAPTGWPFEQVVMTASERPPSGERHAELIAASAANAP